MTHLLRFAAQDTGLFVEVPLQLQHLVLPLTVLRATPGYLHTCVCACMYVCVCVVCVCVCVCVHVV